MKYLIHLQYWQNENDSEYSEKGIYLQCFADSMWDNWFFIIYMFLGEWEKSWYTRKTKHLSWRTVWKCMILSAVIVAIVYYCRNHTTGETGDIQRYSWEWMGFTLSYCVSIVSIAYKKIGQNEKRETIFWETLKCWLNKCKERNYTK